MPELAVQLHDQGEQLVEDVEQPLPVARLPPPLRQPVGPLDPVAIGAFELGGRALLLITQDLGDEASVRDRERRDSASNISRGVMRRRWQARSTQATATCGDTPAHRSNTVSATLVAAMSPTVLTDRSDAATRVNRYPLTELMRRPGATSTSMSWVCVNVCGSSPLRSQSSLARPCTTAAARPARHGRPGSNALRDDSPMSRPAHSRASHVGSRVSPGLASR